MKMHIWRGGKKELMKDGWGGIRYPLRGQVSIRVSKKIRIGGGNEELRMMNEEENVKRKT
jgi:hypothetical protein